MEPELRNKIKEWEKMLTPEQTKKLFIRDSAYRAYKAGNGDIKNVTIEVTKEVIDKITSSSMTKDDIGMLISTLEEARILLSSLTQGFQIAFAEEKEPEFKKKHQKEEAEKKSRTKPNDLNSLLGKLGIDASAFLKDISAIPNPPKDILEPKKAESTTKETVSPAGNSIVPGKIKCDKCGKELFQAMAKIHRC